MVKSSAGGQHHEEYQARAWISSASARRAARGAPPLVFVPYHMRSCHQCASRRRRVRIEPGDGRAACGEAGGGFA